MLAVFDYSKLFLDYLGRSCDRFYKSDMFGNHPEDLLLYQHTGAKHHILPMWYIF